MDLETIRRLTALERRLDNIVMPEKSSDLVSPFLSLPAIRGVWISTVDAAGAWKDCSGIDFDLTPAGNPKHYCPGLIPSWYYDAVGDAHTHPDHVNFDITGTEGWIWPANRGLTMGGWFLPSRTTNFEHIIGKWSSPDNRSYRIVNNTGSWLAQISPDGGSGVNVGGGAVTAGKWYFLVIRFVPNTTLDFWVNRTKNTLATDVPASIFNGNALFAVAAEHGIANFFLGYAACCFLCAAAISDAQRASIFEQTRGAFGV